VDVEPLQRRARAHEQTVAVRPAEAEVGAALRQVDTGDQLALGVEDLYAVQAFLPHAPAAPEVDVDVAAEAVRRALAGVDELALVLEPGAADNADDHDRAWCRSAFDDVTLRLVRRERQPISSVHVARRHRQLPT